VSDGVDILISFY